MKQMTPIRIEYAIARTALAALLVMTTAVVVGCKKKDAASNARPPAIVETTVVEQKDVPIYVDAFGQLTSISSVDIQPQVSGKLLEICVKDGAKVAKGGVIARIDPAEYQATFDKAAATLQGDKAELARKQQTLVRNKVMLDQQLISQETYDGYATDVQAADARVKQDEADVADATIKLGYCTLTSPIDGVAGKRLVDPGNIVAANSTTLVNLRTMDPVYVDFTVPEKYLPIIRSADAKGTLDIHFVPERDVDPIIQEARKSADVSQKKLLQQFLTATYPGKLVFIDNTVNNKTGTIALRAQAENKNGALWPGQFVILGLIVETVKDAVIVPGACVLYGKQGPYAFVIGADDKAQLRLLKLGPEWMNYLIVKEGVKAGERVVSLGQLGLYPGAAVKVRPSTPAAGSAGAAAAGKPSDSEQK